MRLSCLIMFLLSIAAFLPNAGVAQTKSAKKEANPATAADYALLKDAKELNGTIMSLDLKAGKVTLRVDVPVLTPNPKYKPQNADKTAQQDLARIQKLQNEIATAKSAKQVQSKVNQLNSEMQKVQARAAQQAVKASNPANEPFTVTQKRTDFNLDNEENIVVRRQNLSLEYDEKGNVKTYSDKEKADLKGTDKSLPGYSADVNDLNVGQVVKITLKQPKADTKKTSDKDAAGDDTAARPTVKMIVIVQDNDGAAGSTPAAPKKGKK